VRIKKTVIEKGLIKAKAIYLRASARYLSDSLVSPIDKSFSSPDEKFKGSFFPN
jgi:hypothetical protein